MKKTQLRCMIPIKCPDLNKLFSTKRDADKARILLQHLFFVKMKLNDNEHYAPGINREDNWCPVFSESIQQLVRDYNRIFKKLIASNVIEYKSNTTGGKSYYPGKYSSLYRIKSVNKTMADEVNYRVEYATTDGVIRAVKRYSTKTFERQSNMVINQIPYYKTSLEFMEKLRLKMSEEEFNAFPQRTQAYISSFNDATNWFVTRDMYGHRIFSHISNMPKVLRKHLVIDGEEEPLVLVDVKCSQPYFLSAVFRYPNLIQLVPEFTSLILKMMKYGDCADIQLMYNDTSKSSDFYKTVGAPAGLDKETIKPLLFKHILFSSPFAYKNNDAIGRERLHIQSLFSYRYPRAFELLQSLKHTRKVDLPFVYEVTEKTGSNGRMYTTPNMLAQRVESAILLDRVTKLCAHRNIETVTIHDAWIMRESDLKEFKLIFHAVFNKLGLNSPNLETTRIKCSTII